MGILKSSVKGVRQGIRKGKLGKTLSEWFSQSRLNPGSWAEDIGRGLGIQTRGKPNWVGGRAATPARNVQGMGGTIHAPAVPAVAPTGGHRNLTGAGYALQGLGLAGAGTLGAKMIAGTEPSHDENGVKTGKQNEEALKVREKFQKEKLGGANKFNNALLEHNSKNSQWVKTAIKGIGMEKYKKMRASVAADPSKAGALHTALISELAKVGDEEMMKQAASEPYVLPGLAKVGDDARRVIVMSPQKGKDKKTSYTALQYDYDEGDDQ